MSLEAAYQQRAEAEFADRAGELVALVARAEADKAHEGLEEVSDLRAFQEKVRSELDAMRASAEEASDEMKATLHHDLEELRDKIDEVIGKHRTLREALVKKHEADLRRFDAELARWEDKIREEVDAGQRIHAEEFKLRIRDKWQIAKEHLVQLRKARDEQLSEVHESLGQAWTEMKSRFAEAQRRFRA